MATQELSGKDKAIMTAPMKHIAPLDYSSIGGGLVRMLDRLMQEASFTGDAEEDAFLRQHPNAALLGLLFDQRVRAEYAFMGPRRLYGRIGHLDMRRIRDMDEEEMRLAFAERPAVHRFSNKMADYTRSLASAVVDEYGGDASKIWDDGASSATIQKRIQKLPGFGPGKSAKMKYVLHYLGYRDFSRE